MLNSSLDFYVKQNVQSSGSTGSEDEQTNNSSNEKPNDGEAKTGQTTFPNRDRQF